MQFYHLQWSTFGSILWCLLGIYLDRSLLYLFASPKQNPLKILECRLCDNIGLLYKNQISDHVMHQWHRLQSKETIVRFSSLLLVKGWFIFSQNLSSGPLLIENICLKLHAFYLSFRTTVECKIYLETIQWMSQISHTSMLR